MAAPTPLFPDGASPEEPLDSPEILAINALLGSGRFDPQAYGLTVDMLAGFQQAWRWCEDYQEKVGEAPPVELFHRSFPTIELLSGVDPRWAADKLKQAHYEREVRRKLAEASKAVREGHLDDVREIVRDLVQPSPLSKPKGMNALSIDTIAAQGIQIGFNVAWPALQGATNGHGRGEFWTIAARFGVGKSQLVPGMAIAAADQGAKVAIASCEMTMRQYAKRIHRYRAAGDLALLHALRDPDEKVRRVALESLTPLVGSIDIFDPSTMRMNPQGIENLASEYDVVWVDHIGLMRDSQGRRAVEDWRHQAIISNEMKEIALRQNTAIGAVVQVNRQGESVNAPPSPDKIAGSDAIGQDSEVIMMLKRMGERTLLVDVPKIREGRATRFYIKFEPDKGVFDEITVEEARLRQSQDNDQAAAL